ncbi:MAG: hypothetical protein QF535_15490 [Anaerolineales bacterium]|jgi:hypothetical protein|nr:hypothetical protein [Anaerolineales bacterium]
MAEKRLLGKIGKGVVSVATAAGVYLASAGEAVGEYIRLARGDSENVPVAAAYVDNVDSSYDAGVSAGASGSGDDGLEGVVSSGSVPFNGQIVQNGRVLYDLSGTSSAGDVYVSSTDASKYDVNAEGGDKEALDDPTPVNSVRDLMGDYVSAGYVTSEYNPDDNLEFRDVSGNTSIVSNEWSVGLIKDGRGFVGYADNVYLGQYGGTIDGFLEGSYSALLDQGESPDGVIFFNDVNGDGLGHIAADGGHILGEDDKVYFARDVLFDGVRGDVSGLPGRDSRRPAILPHMEIAYWTTDGMPIAWAKQFYDLTNDFEVISRADTDGDGHTAREEFEADTDPTNPNSAFRINCDNGVFSFDTSARCSYNVYSSTDLQSWTNVLSDVSGTGGDIAVDLRDDSDKVFLKAGVTRVNR